MISLLASFAPAQATFTIFGPFPIISTTYGVGSVPLVPPTSNSPAPWTFTSSNPKVATISGTAIIVLGAGTSTITASQLAMGAFTSRKRSTQIRVGQGTPALGVFTQQSISITQRTFTLVPPTSTSDGLWSFLSTNPNVASLDGNKVTFHAGGFTLIYATQSPTTNWRAASIFMKFTVMTIPPVLGSFGDVTIMKDSVGSINLIAPKSTSPGSWTFTSSNPSVASVASSTVTPLAFGTSVITATQAAIGDYASATTSMNLTVQGPIPTIGPFPNVAAQMSLSSLILQPPTSTSLGTWSFTSSDPTVASTNGAVATFLKPGTTTITATQSPTAIYASPSPVTMTLTVVGAPSIGSWADIQKVVKDADFSLAPPTSTSSGAWTYSSSNPAVAEVVNGVVKVKSTGEATITASQAPTTIWLQGNAKMTIRVFSAIPTLGSFAPIEAAVGDAPLVLKPPSSNSPGTWIYTSSDKKVAVVDGSSLSIVGVGTATITATQNPAGTYYSQSNAVQTTITVKAKSVLTPTPTPTPKPTATTSPRPTASPSVTPSAKPTSSPSTTAPIPPINATVKATASGRVVTVVAIGVKALVFINGKPAKVGMNKVLPGVASVVITISDKVVYRRVFIIK